MASYESSVSLERTDMLESKFQPYINGEPNN